MTDTNQAIRHLDLLVVSKFKNLKLFALMDGKTQAEVARECAVQPSSFGGLLNLRRSPFLKDGSYCHNAELIAAHFKMLTEDLFPVSLYALTLPKEVQRAYSSQAVMLSLSNREVLSLPAPEVTDDPWRSQAIVSALGTLTPREDRVMRMLYGIEDCPEHTLEEVAEWFTVSAGRIQQIEAKALRKLRHPSRSRTLVQHLDGVLAEAS